MVYQLTCVKKDLNLETIYEKGKQIGDIEDDDSDEDIIIPSKSYGRSVRVFRPKLVFQKGL